MREIQTKVCYAMALFRQHPLTSDPEIESTEEYFPSACFPLPPNTEENSPLAVFLNPPDKEEYIPLAQFLFPPYMSKHYYLYPPVPMKNPLGNNQLEYNSKEYDIVDTM